MRIPSPLYLVRRVASWWRHEFEVYRSPAPEAAAIRARHLHTVSRLTPLMLGTNLLGALLLATALRDKVPSIEIGPWLAALLAYCVLALGSWHRRRARPPQAASPRAIARTVRGALLLSLPWGMAPALWFHRIGHDGQQLLSTIVVGFMCGGAFALTSVPQAALAYLATITLGSLIGLAAADGLVNAYLQALVAMYFVALGASVIVNARIHTARLESERESERKGQLVGLLLRDFEENAADLLWEVDAGGTLSHVSARLAAALGSSPVALRSCRLADALGSAGDTDAAPSHSLARALAGVRPFRDLVVPVTTAQGPRWWSFTAKPLLDPAGVPSGWRGVISDVSAAREAQQRMQTLAHTDALTGLANRVQLAERVTAALERCATGDRVLAALVCLDIDHFKSINDSLGHSAGDAVLSKVARRMRESLRRCDLPARLGGDEFAILVEQVESADEVRSLAQRLVAALCRQCNVDGHAFALSVSIGVALLPEHGRTLDELLTHADLALYAAKEAGRGRCEFFEPRLGDRHRRRVLLAQELQSALARGELHLHWQPQQRLADRRIVAAEALLRWRHPALGNVGPAEFIPVAEDSGQIVAIGAWALAQACTGAVAMPGQLRVAVNVSPAQLMRDDFVTTVRAALAASGLPAHRLEIEITESLLMDAVPVALANLHALRELGVRIQLDDFGTGYSSLAYLRKFPFDGLKIDRAFVAELTERADAHAIVRSIVELARCLRMETIAEGVEDEAQLAILRAAGCAMVQGYLIARPMPAAQLRRLLDGEAAGEVERDRQITFA